jgi:cytochrome c-type biogenesis protein CcmH
METEAIWTWALIAALALAALIPLLAAALRRPRDARRRGEADLALYRAQLAELDREREAGRLDAIGHRAAMVEVQRRLLTAPEDAAPRPEDSQAAKGARIALLGAIALVPAFATWAYTRTGTPGMPSASYAVRQDAQARDDVLLRTLRERLAALDPRSEPARAGYALLGNAERGRGQLEAAAAAYRDSLRAGFDPQVAGQLAQVLLEQDKIADARTLLAAALPLAPRDIGLRFLSGLAAARSGQAEEARRIWQALVDEAPQDAPWRAMVQRRMADLP